MGLWRSGLDWRPLSRCLNKYWGEPEGNTNKSLPNTALYQKTRNEVYFCWEDRRSEHALVNFHSLHVCDIFPLHHPVPSSTQHLLSVFPTSEPPTWPAGREKWGGIFIPALARCEINEGISPAVVLSLLRPDNYRTSSSSSSSWLGRADRDKGNVSS